MKVNRVINTASLILVGLLAVAAFVLSYTALKDLAQINGIPHSLAWIWPLTIDGFLAVATLSVLRNSLLGERAWFQWALVILFTGASVVFNVIHAGGDVLTMVVGAVPPVALALALELTMGQLKSEVSRSSAVATVSELHEKIDVRRQEIGALEEERDGLVQEIRSLKRRRADANSVDVTPVGDIKLSDVTRSEDAQEAIQRMLAFYDQNPKATQQEAGDAAGRSRSWVSQTLSDLEERGVVSRNGDGIRVLAA